MIPDTTLDAQALDVFRTLVADHGVISVSHAVFLLGKALFVFPMEATRNEFPAVFATGDNELFRQLHKLLVALARDEPDLFVLTHSEFALAETLIAHEGNVF